MQGLHHVSSIVNDQDKTYWFYHDILGLNRLKQTLNYEDKRYKHDYYGDSQIHFPLSTFFPRPDLRKGILRGKRASTLYYRTPKPLVWWEKHLRQFGIQTTYLEQGLSFYDPDEIHLVIETDETSPVDLQWVGVEIRGQDYLQVGHFLNEVLSLKAQPKADRTRYYFTDDSPTWIDLVHENYPPSTTGTGIIHHIAFICDDLETLIETLDHHQIEHTEIKDRNYFKSLYFTIPQGLLVEAATSYPGLSVDEDTKHLGETLIIPKHFKEEL